MGNSPSLNLERAFRVTSHSSATSTVTYSGNTVNGANIGYQWLAGSNFTGNLAVRLIDDTITNCDTGVLVQSNGVAHLETDVITGSGAGGGVHIVTGMLAGFGANPNGIDHSFVSGGSGDGVLFDATATTLPAIIIIDNDLSNNTGFGLKNLTANPVTALTNYWGSNLTANVAAKVNGPATFDPWLASGTDISASTGFQPFIYATTTTAANLTTLAGTAAADTGSMLNTSPVTLTMDGDTGFVPVAQLLNVSIQLGNSDDVFTLDQTGIPTTFDGGAGNDTLIGTNVAQTWNITGANSGNIPGATSGFSNVESLRGGTAADSFVFSAAGSVAQSIDGNLGIDTLDNTAIPAHIVNPTGPGTLDGFMGTATGVGTTFDNINIIAAPADLAVTKSGPATANAGTVISYTITVTNNGPNPAINATLADTIPAGTTFSSLVAPGGWSCVTPAVNGTGTVTCSMGIDGGRIGRLHVECEWPGLPCDGQQHRQRLVVVDRQHARQQQPDRKHERHLHGRSVDHEDRDGDRAARDERHLQHQRDEQRSESGHERFADRHAAGEHDVRLQGAEHRSRVHLRESERRHERHRYLHQRQPGLRRDGDVHDRRPGLGNSAPRHAEQHGERHDDLDRSDDAEHVHGWNDDHRRQRRPLHHEDCRARPVRHRQQSDLHDRRHQRRTVSRGKRQRHRRHPGRHDLRLRDADAGKLQRNDHRHLHARHAGQRGLRVDRTDHYAAVDAGPGGEYRVVDTPVRIRTQATTRARRTSPSSPPQTSRRSRRWCCCCSAIALAMAGFIALKRQTT